VLDANLPRSEDLRCWMCVRAQTPKDTYSLVKSRVQFLNTAMPPAARRPKPRAKPYSYGESLFRRGKAASKNTRPKTKYTPYQYPAFAGTSNLYFDTEATWDAGKLVAGIKGVKFGDKFNIKDSHIDALANAELGFRSSLLNLSCGNSDNGYGGSLTTEAVVRLASACPNLVSVQLEAARNLDDTALLAIAENCKDVVFIGISGHDRGLGKISDTALKTLKGEKKVATKLRYLYIVDQPVSKACKALSKARKALAIIEGRTEGDGIAAQWLASGEPLTTWFGGKEVGEDGEDMGFDDFW